MRKARMLGTVILSLVFAAGFGISVPNAQAAAEISEYIVSAIVNPDGSIDVKASITTGDSAPLVQTFSTVQEITDRREYVFTLTDVKVVENGTEAPAQLTTSAGEVAVTLPATNGVHEFSYRVLGAAVNASDGEIIVSWDYLQGLTAPVAVFDADVTAGLQFNMIDCAAGDPYSPGACTFYGGGTHEYPNPTFHSEDVAAGDIVRATLRFPEGTVAANEEIREHWTFDRAFSAEPLELMVALGLLILGGLLLWLTHRRLGRDVKVTHGERIAEFHPVSDGKAEFRVLNATRPGLIGTVLDERVDPIDITATLLDLAVRGHLLIKELPRASAYALADWSLTRQSGNDELATYEKTLLDAVSPNQGEAVLVSNLAGHVHQAIPAVQSQLYDEVVARGYFARRPDSTRNTWHLLGGVSITVAALATIALAAWTSFGLTGLALVALSLGLIFVAGEMPARTAKGVAVLRGLQLLAGTLETQPADSLPQGDELKEISELLPYTVVLGGMDRWLEAIIALDNDEDEDCEDVYWYHGPAGWHLQYLADSIHSFVVTVEGALFTRH